MCEITKGYEEDRAVLYLQHEYTVRTCDECGISFCFSCCGATNVDQGGEYEPDYMRCPVCWHDIYND